MPFVSWYPSRMNHSIDNFGICSFEIFADIHLNDVLEIKAFLFGDDH